MKKLKNLFCVTAALILFTGMFAGCGGGEKDNVGDGGSAACTHANLTKVDGKDSTCYEEGNYTYYKCDDCGELFSDKNAQRPTSLQDVTISKTRHDMHRYEEQVAGYTEYYFCNFCGRYYEDYAGSKEIPYSAFADSSVAPVSLPNGWTDSAGANAQTRDFTIRCFIGWTNSEGKTFAEFPKNGTVMINVNLNRKCTLNNDGWYGFGIEYTASEGLRYRNFGTDTRTSVASEFTELFVEQGGIWVRIVRQGTNCSFYFEDKYGIPIHISTNADFEADEALYRFAFGYPNVVDGWVQSPAKSEICWGIANPRCVFTEQS